MNTNLLLRLTPRERKQHLDGLEAHRRQTAPADRPNHQTAPKAPRTQTREPLNLDPIPVGLSNEEYERRVNELYAVAEIAVSIAIRAKHESSGLHMYREIQMAFWNDQKARSGAVYLSAAEEAKARRTAAHDMKSKAERAALSATATPDERAWAAELAAEYRTEEEQERTEAEAEEEAARSVTFSEMRSDLTQEALTAIIDTWTNPAPITADRIAAAGYDDPEAITPEDWKALQSAANFRAAINAAGRAASHLATGNAMDGHSTTSKPATAEEVAQWVKLMGGTGKEYRRSAYRRQTKATDCFQTMEQREPKKSNPSGWYLVTHYKTVAKVTSLESYEERTGHALIAPEGDFQTATEAAEALAEIVKAAKLTERERKAIRLYCDPHAEPRATAEAVEAEYRTRRSLDIAAMKPERQTSARKAMEETARNKADRARWCSALTLAGYPNERARQRGQKAIIAALFAARHHAPGTVPGTDPIRTRPEVRPDPIQITAPKVNRLLMCDPDTGRMIDIQTPTAAESARYILRAYTHKA